MSALMSSDVESVDADLIRSNFRTVYTEEAFEKVYPRHIQSKSVSYRQKFCLSLCKALQRIRLSCCGPRNDDGFGHLVLNCFYHIFPFIDVLRYYDARNWLMNDIITGFTVGVMHVPQGMAYAMLATVPPVCGLYCSMFASFFYFFLGTSRHLSLGTVAAISLLVSSCLDRKIPLVSSNALTNESAAVVTSDTPADDANDDANRILLASTLAFTVGIMQLIMSLLRLGFITRLLSDPMLTGFTVGLSVYAGVSQLFVVFGLSLEKHTGIFNLPRNFFQICANLPNTNWVTFGLSLSCIFILYAFQLWINPPLRKRIKVPVPVELLVIIFGGVVSSLIKLKDKYNVKVIGTVPAGFPSPELPRLSLIGELIGDAFVVAIVSFSLAYSLASFYGNKEGYKVAPNQELLAYGIGNAAGSFFTAYPNGPSISRTVLVNSMGGKSQIVSLIASIFILFVVLFAGPLFYQVPNCCLSAIILVALRGLFRQLLELPVLWRYSVWDFTTWVVAFLATIFLDILEGLIVGVAFSALLVFFRAQLSKAFTVTHVADTEVFRSDEDYNICVENPKIKIIRYEGSLFYAGMDRFVSSVVEASGFDPRPIAFARKKLDATIREADTVLNFKENEGNSDEIELASQYMEVSTKGSTVHIEIPEDGDRRSEKSCPTKFRKRNISRTEAADRKKNASDQLSSLLSTVPLTHVILDGSAWTFIDIVGANTLKSLLSDFNSAGVTVYLGSLSRRAYKSLLRSGLFEKFNDSIVFISVFDAYTAAQQQQHNQQQNERSEAF